MCTFYFILSWTGFLGTGDDWTHEEGWVSADPLWQWWCWPGSYQHLSACWMYSVHHCWYSGEAGIHQKTVSTGTWIVHEEIVNSGNTCSIQLRSICIPIFCLSGWETVQNCDFCILFCMGVKLVFSHWGKNINWGCFRVEKWGRYLGLRGWKRLETGGNCIMSCMICAPHQILFGWDWQGMWHIQA